MSGQFSLLKKGGKDFFGANIQGTRNFELKLNESSIK